MIDHPDPKEVFAYVLGELRGKRRGEVAEHVAGCESCGQIYNEITSRPASSADSSAPRSRIPSDSRFSSAERIRGDVAWSMPQRLLLVLFLAVVVGVGGYLLQRASTESVVIQTEDERWKADAKIIIQVTLDEAQTYEQLEMIPEAIDKYMHALKLSEASGGRESKHIRGKIESLEGEGQTDARK